MAAKMCSANHAVPHMVEALPYALYESNGRLFELYNGGKTSLPHAITWVRLKPILANSDRVELSNAAHLSNEKGSLWPTS
jgi:hypothetical protein